MEGIIRPSALFAIFRPGTDLHWTFGFTQQTLSNVASVQVLEPDWYREEVREEIARMLSDYGQLLTFLSIFVRGKSL